MAQFPGLMLWTDAWVADTCHLRGPIGRQKRCIYIDLIIKMWRTPGCRVPNDDAWLAEHLFLTLEEVVELLRPVINEFCQTDGNWIFQKRLQKEFLRAAAIQHAQSVRAKSGWKKRKRPAGAMHPDQNRKIESLLYRAREEAEPEEAAEKKETKISAELIQFMAKRTAGEE
jgi:uncharacterized protein YdaU (DUF1376 family)